MKLENEADFTHFWNSPFDVVKFPIKNIIVELSCVETRM